MRSVLAMAWLSSCALPDPIEAGKTRCAVHADCLAGRDCVAGFCVAEGGDHASGDAVTPGPRVCPSPPCTPPQSCFFGLCARAVAAPSCEPNMLPDGCLADSLCFEDSDFVKRCRTLPPCGPGGTCPLSSHGSVCNDGDLPGKNQFCIPKGCRTVSDCPATWSCVRFFMTDPLGFCSSGEQGDVCATNADCDSSDCNQLLRVCN